MADNITRDMAHVSCAEDGDDKDKDSSTSKSTPATPFQQKIEKTNIWRVRVHCLHEHNATHYQLFSISVRKLLKEVGLGSEEIDILGWKTLTEEQFEDILIQTFPLLKQSGGYELMLLGQQNQFAVIPRPYTPVELRIRMEGMNRKLFIRPLGCNLFDANAALADDMRTISNEGESSDSRGAAGDSDGGRHTRSQSQVAISEVHKLTFKNPGKFMEDFDPERSSREMRKMKRKIYCERPRKQSLYDEKGRLLVDKRDLCDCCERHCPGCHFPCPKCRSTKCGLECRVYRRHVYSQVDVEGTTRSYVFVDIGT